MHNLKQTLCKNGRIMTLHILCGVYGVLAAKLAREKKAFTFKSL